MKNKTAIISVTIISLLTLSFLATNGFQFEIVSGVSNENIYFEPLIGSLCCERSDSRTLQVASSSFNECLFGILCKEFHQATIYCNDNVDSSGCDISVKGHAGGLNMMDLWFQEYYADGTCRYPNAGGCNDAWTVADDFLEDNYAKPLTNIKPGSRLELWADVPFTVYKEFTPYVLKIKGSTGGENTFNAESCRVQQTNPYSIVDINQIIQSSTLTPKTGGYEYIYKDTVPFTECINYIDGKWIPILIEFAPTLNGQQVACSAGSIYSIGTITLKDGTLIRATDKVIGTYSPTSQYKCCPGMQTTTQYCGDDWQWHDKSTSSPDCNVDLQCQQGMFIGGWLIDYQEPNSIIRGRCVNGYCDYRAEILQVECTNNGQCTDPNKPMCDVGNTWKCINSEGAIIPGHDITPEQQANLDLWTIFWAGLAGLLTFLITGKKDIRKRDWTGILIALILGIVAGVITYLIIVNIVPIILSLLAFGVIGILLIYFFGGIIASIIIAIMSFINAIRG